MKILFVYIFEIVLLCYKELEDVSKKISYATYITFYLFWLSNLFICEDTLSLKSKQVLNVSRNKNVMCLPIQISLV